MTVQEMPAKRTDHSNVVLWAVFGATVFGTGAYFLIGLHRVIGYDASLAVTALFVRTTILVVAGLMLEAILLRAGDGYFTVTRARRSVLHTYWVVVMFLCVALVVDVMLFAFGGYHLPTAGRILFSDGPAGVGQVVQATGLSLKLILFIGCGVAAGVALAIGLSKWTRRLSSRWSVTIARRKSLLALFVSIGALALLDVAAIRVRNPFLWELELRRVPLAFCLVAPRAELASFRAKVRPFTADEVSGSGPQRVSDAPRPDIVIVIVESLRADVVTHEIMPRFAAFAKDSWTFEHATTTGNVTHYSWYGLLCSRLPVYYGATKSASHHSGSLALRRLREAGYQIHVLATPDLGYQHLEAIVFGDRTSGGDAPYLQEQFRPPAGDVALSDQAVVREFARQIGANPRGGHVYLVALDSSHFEYAWGKDLAPPFVPYAKTVPITHDYYHDARARRLVVNRYKNAVAWIDLLLGRMFDALAAASRIDNTLVVITGDHGEAFWEHETGTHGSSLTREQLEVGFAMRLPQRPARHSKGIFSLLDVMPTLLDEVGLESKGMDGAPLHEHDGSVAALTFQGWNERAYHLSLTLPTTRLVFELDREDPLQAERLVLFDVTDLRDRSIAGRSVRIESGSNDDAIRDLPAALGDLGFITF